MPAVYDAALDHQWTILHAEHATYFTAGCLLWWPVFHGRYSSGTKAVYLFAAFVAGSPLGLLLALLPKPVYHFYEHAPRVWGLSHLADQQRETRTRSASRPSRGPDEPEDARPLSYFRQPSIVPTSLSFGPTPHNITALFFTFSTSMRPGFFPKRS